MREFPECGIRQVVTGNNQGWQVTEVLTRLGGNADLLWELCQIFQDEYPKQVQKLRQAVAENDSDALMYAAHNLKGELGYLGATGTSEAAHELEEMGRNNDLAHAPEKLAQLEAELADLVVRVKQAHGSTI